MCVAKAHTTFMCRSAEAWSQWCANCWWQKRCEAGKIKENFLIFYLNMMSFCLCICVFFNRIPLIRQQTDDEKRAKDVRKSSAWPEDIFSLSRQHNFWHHHMCAAAGRVEPWENVYNWKRKLFLCVLEIRQSFAFIKARFDSILIRLLLGTFLRLCCNVAVLFLCNMLQVGRDFSVVWKVILCSLQSFRLDWSLNFYRNHLQQSGCNLDVDIPLNLRVNVNWMSVQSWTGLNYRFIPNFKPKCCHIKLSSSSFIQVNGNIINSNSLVVSIVIAI